MKIALTEFVTLDGVSQGPGSPTEDTSDDFTRGGWLVPYLDKLFVLCTSDWLGLADGLLLGRRTYEAFARDWPQITDPNDPFTERMNSLPKYVATNTLTEGSWHPTTVLRGDPVQTVGKLKAQPGRELQIHGSATPRIRRCNSTVSVKTIGADDCRNRVNGTPSSRALAVRTRSRRPGAPDHAQSRPRNVEVPWWCSGFAGNSTPTRGAVTAPVATAEAAYAALVAHY